MADLDYQCTQVGCAVMVHREGWRCVEHVPPCGFKTHPADCDCSINETSA